jgi:hypothetical protein
MGPIGRPTVEADRGREAAVLAALFLGALLLMAKTTQALQRAAHCKTLENCKRRAV